MKRVRIAGLIAIAAVQLMDGVAGAQDTRSAIEKALNGAPSKTMTLARPKPEPQFGAIWENGIFAILEARLARMAAAKHAPKHAAVHTCLDIDDQGHVVSAKTCRSSGDAEADKAAVAAATQGGDFPPLPGGLASIKLIWVHDF